MNRIFLILLAVLTLWAGLATWAVLHQRGKLATVVLELRQTADALKRAQRAAKRAEAAVVSAARKNAATARETASATASLHAAAASSPDWASTPVPEAVREALK